MKTAVIALTRNGAETAIVIAERLQGDVYVKEKMLEEYGLNARSSRIHPFAADFASLVQEIFRTYTRLVFVMACGIVVRTIAPHIKDKSSDPAVVVVDEKGKHAISLLSGHVGGANWLAEEVAAATGGTPVITTATDVNRVTAFDLFAAEQDCAIENIEDLKYISSALVNGGQISFHTDCALAGVLPENIVPGGTELECAVLLSSATKPVKTGAKHILRLRPRNLVLGIGCRKGVTAEAIHEAVANFMERNERSMLSLVCAASIDLKKEEKGIVDFCDAEGIPFITLPSEKLQQVEHEFEASPFVKRAVGVGSVSEACAVYAVEGARLLCGKTIYKGITLALGEVKKTYRFRES